VIVTPVLNPALEKSGDFMSTKITIGYPTFTASLVTVLPPARRAGFYILDMCQNNRAFLVDCYGVLVFPPISFWCPTPHITMLGPNAGGIWSLRPNITPPGFQIR
jgi:hypothetical protein